MKPFTILFSLFLALSIYAVAAKPNILIIMCDDLGYADVGFNGATDIPTPHLDALATGGMICKSAYVAHPVCGPVVPRSSLVATHTCLAVNSTCRISITNTESP